MNQYCKRCGSRLGIFCGDAEADYDLDFCSIGCALNLMSDS